MTTLKTPPAPRIDIKIYDMSGRMLDVRNIESSQMESEQLGNNYPVGVYHVVFRQGDKIKTVRIIKR